MSYYKKSTNIDSLSVDKSSKRSDKRNVISIGKEENEYFAAKLIYVYSNEIGHGQNG